MNNAITMANYVTAAACCFVAALALWRIRGRLSGHAEALAMVRGTMITLGALGLHQSYWGLSRWFYAMGRNDAVLWMTNNSWIVTAFYWLAFYGMLRILAVWHGFGVHIRRGDVLIVASIWSGVFVVAMVAA